MKGFLKFLNYLLIALVLLSITLSSLSIFGEPIFKPGEAALELATEPTIQTNFIADNNSKIENKQELIKNYNLRYSGKEYKNRTVLAFDINKEGFCVIVVRLISGTSSAMVYSPEGDFLTSFILGFEPQCVEFNGDWINTRDKTLTISINYTDNSCDFWEPELSNENSSYENALRQKQKQSGTSSYELRSSDNGIRFKKTVVSKTDENGVETIFYDCSDAEKTRTILLASFITVGVFTLVIKLLIDSKKK